MRLKSLCLQTLSIIYGLVTSLKNFLYDAGFADQIQLSTPVLSVGNLSVGGTGKTPVVEWILRSAIEKNLKVAVIARNYKAQSFGPCKVDPMRLQGALFYGDEAFSIAQKFPEVSVWTGPQKYRTAQQAVLTQKFDLLVIDDGFQHRSLRRDFDLVLIDTTAVPEENHLLPQGLLREGFSSLERADAVLLSKVHLSSLEKIESVRQKIPKSLPLAEVSFHSEFFNSISADSRSLAVSGIAKPLQFIESLKLQTVFPVEHLVFSDHHIYSEEDAQNIFQKMKSLECQQVLTTEKDFVKLQNFLDLVPYLNPVQIKAQFHTEIKGLNEFLDKCIHL